MAIVKMKKFKLFALEKDRKSLLKELQKFSYVHFVKPKEDDESLKEIELNQDMTIIKEKSQKVKWMLNYFSKLFPKDTKKEIDESSVKETLFVLVEQQASKYDFSNDYENLANISGEIDSNKEEIANLETYRKELSKWLNIKESLGNLKAFKTAKFFLGTVAKKNFEPLKDKLRNFEHTYIEEISDESSQINIMLLTSNTEEKELKNELKTYSFTETNFNFDTSFTEEYEKTKSREEESNFKATDTVNVIEGYIPLDMEEEFKKIVNKNSNKSNYLEITEVDKDDEEVPILLKNSGITGLFASITQMYALPRYNEIDPTAILSIFYWIFFGMMVADFAYGLILFIISGLALMFGKFDENKKKFLKFFFALSFSTMIWGLLYGSAFGDLIKLPTQVLDSSKDFMSIFILSIIFGAIHLVIALGIKAYILIKNGQFMDVIYDVFLWYLTLTSLIILLLAGRFGLSEFTKNIFIACAVIGMLGIVVFGARDAKTLVGRIGGGLYSLYGITSYIGDFVSYLRLMALGLAGGFIASAINIIVKMLVSKGILGIILGIVVFTLGQSFNIFLSFLSSYVHTSRLTYVEFFSKFYEGGGKAFKKFRV